MDSTVRETFMFLTRLAWKSKITLPILVTAVFLAMDFRLQIEVNYEADGMIFRDEVDSLASGDEEEEDFDGSTEDEISEGAQYNAIDDEDEENAARNQYVLGVQRISQNVSPF